MIYIGLLGKDVKYCKIIPERMVNVVMQGLFMGFSAPWVKSLRLPWQQQRTTFLAEQIVCHAQLVHSSRPYSLAPQPFEIQLGTMQVHQLQLETVQYHGGHFEL